jgi:hypothetical protein
MSDMLGGNDVPSGSEISGCKSIMFGILLVVIAVAVVIIIAMAALGGRPVG